MAKDGTNRGGRRVRAGDKPKPLAEKIAAGEDADIIEFTPTVLEGADLDDAADLVGEEMPSPGEYLSARQKDGKPLGADEIYKETWLWLKNRGCEKLVNKRLLESYSLAFARFIQCEDALSTYGLLGKHPTTGGVVASPFASLSQSYQKQANLLWYEIFDIVKQNCTLARHTRRNRLRHRSETVQAASGPQRRRNLLGKPSRHRNHSKVQC